MQLAAVRTRRSSGRFSPPYTTINIGTIRGGTALNIIPKTCSFLWEYRMLPGRIRKKSSRASTRTQRTTPSRMRAVFPGAKIETKVAPNLGLAAMDGDPGDARHETRAMQFGGGVSYNTEAGLFQLADIPTVVCGPGDIARRHKPDEFIEISQVKVRGFHAPPRGHMSQAPL